MARKIKRYSEAFKRQVVAEYEAGSTLSELRKKYGITGGQTVQTWIKTYAKEGLRHDVVRIQQADEIDRIKKLEAEVKELEQALGKMTLEKLALESIVEELQEEDPDGIKKNEPPSSSGVPPKLGDKKGST
jgi:transposase-like protein